MAETDIDTKVLSEERAKLNEKKAVATATGTMQFMVVDGKLLKIKDEGQAGTKIKGGEKIDSAI